MNQANQILHEQFDDLEQQHQADEMGMWVFLATELLLFGGLFLGYTVYRHAFPQAFQAAISRTEYAIGTINTVVLIVSSLFMARAVQSVHTGNRRALTGFLMLTLLLGLTFLGLKALEYYLDYQKHEIPGLNFVWNGPEPNHAALFFVFYFFMTGLHAIHLTVGCTLIAIMTVLAWRGKFTPDNDSPIVLSGLYWHFIDIVWVFLYPLLYLSGGPHH